jgi:hypothetical protein
MKILDWIIEEEDVAEVGYIFDTTNNEDKFTWAETLNKINDFAERSGVMEISAEKSHNTFTYLY